MQPWMAATKWNGRACVRNGKKNSRQHSRMKAKRFPLQLDFGEQNDAY